jgi:hypothetical protein
MRLWSRWIADAPSLIWENGVRRWRWRRRRLVMCSQSTPCTVRASAIKERWQRQGTASAHMMASHSPGARHQVLKSRLEFSVGQAGLFQLVGKGLAAELRVVRRSRDRAHVGHAGHAMHAHDLDELLKRTVGEPYAWDEQVAPRFFPIAPVRLNAGRGGTAARRSWRPGLPRSDCAG